MLPEQNIDWVMATASDAKGWLPMWMQKLGVPSAVVKDVGLFMYAPFLSHLFPFHSPF